jgi:hypothetical protein
MRRLTGIAVSRRRPQVAKNDQKRDDRIIAGVKVRMVWNIGDL